MLGFSSIFRPRNVPGRPAWVRRADGQWERHGHVLVVYDTDEKLYVQGIDGESVAIYGPGEWKHVSHPLDASVPAGVERQGPWSGDWAVPA